MKRLIERAHDEAKARLVILTPPPFDPYRRRVADPNAIAFGYKFPAVDYDNTLEQYGRWLLTLRDKGIVVADVHTTMNEHLRRRRAGKVSFALQDDGVHPGPTGHWLMAQTLLEAWKAPAVCSEARIDARKLRVEAGDITNLKRDGQTISWTWRTPLPMPTDPRWDKESIALENVSDRLNRHRLTVTGLSAVRYRLIANEAAIAEVGRENLEKGLDLLHYADFPTNQLSQTVLSLIQERHRIVYAAWRKSIAPAKTSDQTENASFGGDVERRAAEIQAEIRRLCQPKEISLRLVPLSVTNRGENR